MIASPNTAVTRASLRCRLTTKISVLCAGLAVLFALSFIGCEYDVPITSKPTRDIEESLLGTWTSSDGKSQLKVYKWDKANYLVMEDGSFYRVYHSDVAKIPLVSVQLLEGKTPTFAYWTWELIEGRTLSLRIVNDTIVLDDTKDSAAVQKLIKANLNNPDLFSNKIEYNKDD